jgi:DNA-binding MarR family transcriptional regulator
MDFDAIDVTIALGRAASTVERHLAKQLKDFDITPVALQVLISVLLANGGPLDLTTLGEEVRVTKANVSLVLQGLERRKLVERAAEPTDARRIRVSLTPSGHKVLEELMPLSESTMEQALSALSARDRQELRRILRRIDVATA